MKEWMKCICPRFTPSRIMLMESAQSSISRTVLLFDLIFFHARDYDVHVT